MKNGRIFSRGTALAMIAMVFSGCASLAPETTVGQQEQVSPRPPSLSLSMTRSVPVAPSASAASPASRDRMPDQVQGRAGGPVDGRGEVYSYLLQAGDPVVIHLRGIYPQDQEVEDIIDDNGNITLPFLGDIMAGGKSTFEVEADIRDRYISGGYYRNITVSVVMPQRTYFIRGEVRAPGRFPVVGGLTMLQAIAAAGGYTEFANTRRVNLIRGGRTIPYNMRDVERNPELDIRLESGDVIVVERSLF